MFYRNIQVELLSFFGGPTLIHFLFAFSIKEFNCFLLLGYFKTLISAVNSFILTGLGPNYNANKIDMYKGTFQIEQNNIFTIDISVNLWDVN